MWKISFIFSYFLRGQELKHGWKELIVTTSKIEKGSEFHWSYQWKKKKLRVSKRDVKRKTYTSRRLLSISSFFNSRAILIATWLGIWNTKWKVSTLTCSGNLALSTQNLKYELLRKDNLPDKLENDLEMLNRRCWGKMKGMPPIVSLQPSFEKWFICFFL